MKSRPASLLRLNLRFGILEGASLCVMVGVGEAYIAAFALALGYSDVVTGLLTTVPLLAGAFLQLSGPRMMRKFGSYKKWVVICAHVQSLALIPMAIAAYVGSLPVWGMFAITTVYWAAGMSLFPAWNSWMETLIPKRIRATYLSKRARIMQFSVVIGLTIGGVFLEASKRLEFPTHMFAVLFGMGACFRYLSARFLRRQSEGRGINGVANGNQRSVGFLELAKRFRTGRDARLLGFLATSTVAVMISGPFYTPYMLNQIGLSYLQFLALLGAVFVAKMIVFPFMGSMAKRWGATRLLWVGGLTIALQPACWLISDNFYYLLFLQGFSGVCWAAFEMATALLFFEDLKSEERTSLLTMFTFANCGGMVAGSLMGGAMLRWFGEGPDAYMLVFLVSSLARCLAMPLAPQSVRPTVGREVIFRPVSVRPAAGSIDRPVVAAMATPPPQPKIEEDS